MCQMGAHFFGGKMQLQDPKTHEQLIQKLKEKKVVITDDKVANRLINLVNYYRLKGYLLPYTVKGKKECFKPIPVEQLEAVKATDFCPITDGIACP